MEKATFSQHNEMVDFAAPGSSIVSTTAFGKGGISWLEIPVVSANIDVRMMALSPPPTNFGVQGPIVLCPDLGVEKCPGGGGQVCLIER